MPLVTVLTCLMPPLLGTLCMTVTEAIVVVEGFGRSALCAYRFLGISCANPFFQETTYVAHFVRFVLTALDLV